MAIVPKQLVIVGAGKIAKSYLADIFGVDAGYHIVFLTHHALQARQMREAGSYTLFRTHADGSFTRVKIADYDAFGMDEEYSRCVDAVSRAPYVALPIFPAAIEDVGRLLADGIQKRLAEGETSPMDLLICVNFLQPSPQIRSAIEKNLKTQEQKEYLAQKVGMVATT